MAYGIGSGLRRRAAPAGARRFATWTRIFLAELAMTSNVSAAARKAGVTTAKVYEARRDDPEFYRLWKIALSEGYELLEMALLQRLRDGEFKPAAGARRGFRTFDNASALRLLAAHKESAAQQRAIRDHEDAGAVLASIDAKLERMRQRSLAAKAEGRLALTDGMSDVPGSGSDASTDAN